MRDKLIHGYFGVDLDIGWKTATQLIPSERPLIGDVIEAEAKKQQSGSG